MQSNSQQGQLTRMWRKPAATLLRLLRQVVVEQDVHNIIFPGNLFHSGIVLNGKDLESDFFRSTSTQDNVWLHNIPVFYCPVHDPTPLVEKRGKELVSTAALHDRVLSSRPGHGYVWYKTWLSTLGTVSLDRHSDDHVN